MTGLRRRAAALALVAGAAFAVPATPARAAACSSGSGVTVVVDFASLGGGSQTRCAAGDPESGITALRGAGFEPTRAAQQPGYFVCRIDGKPASDPCQRTSPEDAYWSYWHARPGGSWSYSSTGPADYDPAPGTVEGWAFGAGDPPSSPPPTAAAPPSASARPSPSPRPAAVSPPPPARSAAPPAPSPATSLSGRTTAPSPAASAVSAAAVSSPTTAPEPPTPTPTPAAAAEPPADDRGSPAGPLLAGLVVAGLAAAAAVQARLRASRR